MSLLNDDRLTQLTFSMFENKGVYAVLVGSGLSRAADIPTGASAIFHVGARGAR